MQLLALDFGSSSIKAAILREGKIVGRVFRTTFPTRYDGTRAEVDASAILRALSQTTRRLGKSAKSVDAIALTTMAPSWLAMDARGRALTPIVTHQDRRSEEIAKEIESRVGRSRHLKLAGNRPFPGGISSTTWAWFLTHERGLMRQCDLVGHLNTFLHRMLTGSRVTDPSNAAFQGVYSTLTLRGWNDELLDAIGASGLVLPDILDGNHIGGRVTPDAARRFGLTQGTPMTVGLMDTSAAMLLAGARVGQLVNTSGSTDVLALCTDHPRPHERLLTRPLGIGRKWLAVSTIAAAVSSIAWARRTLLSDLSDTRFAALVHGLARKSPDSTVRFEPYLAGDRMSIEQRRGGFTGLTLSTTRDDLLAAMIDELARASAARLRLLKQAAGKLRRTVLVSGGVSRGLNHVLYRDWPGRWTFRPESEGTLRGLGMMKIV